MHDIGGLIWVIIVIIAFISSIRKNVQKARKTAAVMRRPQAPAATMGGPVSMRPAAAPRPTPVPVTIAPAPQPPPAPPAAAAPRPPAPPTVAPPHDPFHPDSIRRVRSSGLLGGMFEDKNSILRAVVAAEVLGKPKALQEQSIWSPRHSEPSI